MFPFDPTISLPFLLTAAAMLFTWFRTRRSGVDERFKAGSKRMADLELRVQAVELSLGTMPDKDDMHSLQLMLSEMGGDMKAMRATMRSVAESQGRLEIVTTRHEDYMRENK